jgi:O-antigen/teichoic acid export membrane protein
MGEQATPGTDQPGRVPGFRSAARATFGTQLGIALVSFLNVLVVARELGPSGRGELTLLITISMLTSTLGLLGLDEANVNIAGRRPEQRRALATNSVVLAAVIGLLCAGLLTVLMALFPAIGGGTAAGLRLLALVAIPMLILKILLKFLLQADFRFAAANAAWIMPPALSLVVNVGLALAGALSVSAAFVTWVGAHVLATLFLIAYVAARSVGFGRPSARLARNALGFGGRSHAGRVMMLGNYRLDQWFVGAMAGPHELGLYSIAVAFSEVLLYLPTALTISQRPYLVRAKRADAARRAARVFRASTLLTAAAAAGVILFAPLLCVTVFGADFRGSVDDLRVLAAGAVGVLALKLLGNALTAQGRPGLATAGAAAAFAVTLGLDIALIPAHGGLGAAIASTAAYSTGGIACGLIFARFFRFPARRLLPRPLDLSTIASVTIEPAFRRRGEARAP